MSSLSDKNVESKQDSETQIMSNLLIVFNASSGPTFSKLCATRLFRFQWQTENLQLELVLLGPGFNSISPEINNSNNEFKVRTVIIVFLESK